jgi:TrkA domain protein
VNVEVTPLPGIGTRQDFVIAAGRRIGVVTHRDGHYDLIISGRDDPDACAVSVPLTNEESNTLASLLGAPNLVATLAEQQRDVDGVNTRQFPISEGSPFDGHPLGDTAMRTRTGVSIVAVIRAGTVAPSPGPDFGFLSGDMIVCVGTPKGLRAARRVLTDG